MQLCKQAIPEPRILTGAASTRDNRLSPYFDDGGFRPSSLQSLTVGLGGGGGGGHHDAGESMTPR